MLESLMARIKKSCRGPDLMYIDEDMIQQLAEEYMDHLERGKRIKKERIFLVAQPELLKLEEEKTHINVKLKNTSKELERRKEEKTKHMVEIEKLRNDLKDFTEQLDTLQTNDQSEGKVHLADDQLDAYNRMKEEAVIETNKLRQKKKVLDSEQRAEKQCLSYTENSTCLNGSQNMGSLLLAEKILSKQSKLSSSLEEVPQIVLSSCCTTRSKGQAAAAAAMKADK
ncbi:structural maintenance of chromosomes protein 1 [Tanacetum coccineum]|uniref:Structural maintenance of chromosomes protein 1 n=1 Tax=Tanacetum coccineum TaxID=301880 RepID=A0ABQ5BRB8_9ASTR